MMVWDRMRGQSRASLLRFALAGAALVAALLAMGVGSSRATGTFEPTVTFNTTTTRATAHPDAQITIDNSQSSSQIESMTIGLPDGMWGSLAAANKCTGPAATPGDNAFGECPAATKIGTVTNVAEVDESIARLRGNVYLADASAAGPQAAANDPSSILIVIDPKVGGVLFKPVVLAARAQVRYAPPGAGSATDAVGAPVGITTTVDGIPTTVDPVNPAYGTVTFKLKSVTLDLQSHIENIATTPPLLTNPSRCVSSNFTWSATSYDSTSDSGTSVYTTNDCGTVKFGPTASFNTLPTAPTAGSTVQFQNSINFPADNGSGNGSIRNITVKLPPEFGPNAPSFGSPSDMCPSLNVPQAFSPSTCPPQARIGTATIRTPLLPDPVIGDVYFINKAPLPYLGIDVSPTATNPAPKGVYIRIWGTTSTATLLNQSCDDSFCQAQISASFVNLPDAPISSIQMDLTAPDNREGSSLSGKMFALIPGGDPLCQPSDDYSATFNGWAVPTAPVSSVSTQTVSGCQNASGTLTLTGGPYGTTTTDTTPTFTFTDTNPDECSIDRPTPFDAGDGTGGPMDSCSSSYTPSTPLSIGLHRFFITNGTQKLERVFQVVSSAQVDSTAPSTTIDSGPADNGTTATATPSFTFSSDDGSATFTCSVDDSAFMPCSSPFETDPLTTGAQHKFSVRATDASGNPDLSADSRTFDVKVPFDPQVTVTPSSNVARAHPSLDVAIDNPSAENIKDFKMSMPDGFFGGLTGVAQVCTKAQANFNNIAAPTCPAAAQIGTVNTHGVVLSDDGVTPSDVYVGGKVYLTEGIEPGQPAGLLISVHAKVSTVDLGYINFPVQVAVREHALGVDTLAFNVPESITSQYGETVAFQLRHLDMHIDTGAGAPYPLLTNPSQCEPQAFTTTMTGYDGGTATSSSPFNVIGCSNLSFAPQFGMTLTDQAGKPAAASDPVRRIGVDLKNVISYSTDGAGIKSIVVTLPPTVTIDVQKLPAPCTLAQQAMDACPPSTEIGSATATTPLLPTPLSGKIYFLQAEPGTGNVLPRIFLALRGAINTDIIGTNLFANVATHPQILTRFDVMPDAPLTMLNFQLGNSFLTTRFNACDYGPDLWSVDGVMTGYNGAQAGIHIPQLFDCPQAYNPTGQVSFKKRSGSKSTLTIHGDPQTGNKLRRFKIKLPHGVSFNRKAFTKRRISHYVTVRVNGRKLKTKCFKRRSSTVFEVNFCKKHAKNVKVAFRKGAIKVTRRAGKHPKIKLYAIDTGSSKWRRVQLIDP